MIGLRLRLVARRYYATVKTKVKEPLKGSTLQEELRENKLIKYRIPLLNIDIQRQQYPDIEINDEVSQRLADAYRYFSNHKKIDKGAWNTFEYYDRREESISFIEDLMAYPLMNIEMISHLVYNFSASPAVRQMVLADLFKLVMVQCYPPMFLFLKIFGEANQTSLAVINMVGFAESCQDRKLENEIRSLLSNAIVRLALESGETVMAVGFILQMHEANLKVSKAMVSLVCQSLCIANKSPEIYNAYFLLRLVQKFPLYKYLRYLEAMKVMDFLASTPQSNIFAYLFYNKVLQRYTKLKISSQRGSHFSSLFKLISQNIEVLNVQRANDVWFAWKDLLLAQESKTIDFNCIVKLIEVNEEEPKIQLKIVNSIPKELIEANEILFDFFTKYYGTHYNKYSKEFDDFVKGLKPPLRRLTVSLLFISFLSQNNEVGSERLLQLILKSPNGLNKFEFEAITKKLILQGSIEQCINMSKRTDIQVSSLGYIRLLRHLLLYNSNTEMLQEFLPALISKFNKIHQGDALLIALTETIFSYISDKISNRASRSLFIRLFKSAQDQQMGRAPGDQITLEKFELPNELVRFLDVEQDPVRILRVILDFSVVEEDLVTLKWAIDQMRYHNVSTRDTVAYVMNTNAKFAESIFVEGLIASCK